MDRHSMTTPIDPGDTAALAKIAYDQLWHFNNERFEERGDKDQEKYRKIASAVARAVCPPGHHVIADDDLRRLYGLGIAFKGLLNTLGEEDGEHYPLNDEDLALLDRLRALIGDE